MLASEVPKGKLKARIVCVSSSGFCADSVPFSLDDVSFHFVGRHIVMPTSSPPWTVSSPIGLSGTWKALSLLLPMSLEPA